MNRKVKILLIDDDTNILKSIVRILRHSSYEFHCTTDPGEAFELLSKLDFDVIITDQRMPMHTGIDILKYSKKFSPDTIRILITGYSNMNVIVSAVNEGNIFSYISKPWDNNQLIQLVRGAVQHKLKQDANKEALNNLLKDNEVYEHIISQLRKESSKRKEVVFNTLLKIIKARDSEIYNHSIRVKKYAMQIADLLELSKNQKTTLKYASLLHDIGKIAIRDRILFKPGKLSDEEYEMIKYHPLIAADILKEIDSMVELSTIVCQHHEKIDGSGYPYGIKGEEIMLEAKILAVADVYDALTTDRVYREKLAKEEALDILKRESKVFLDENIVNLFVRSVYDEL